MSFNVISASGVKELVHDALRSIGHPVSYTLEVIESEKSFRVIISIDEFDVQTSKNVRVEVQSDGIDIGGGCWVKKRLVYSCDYNDAWVDLRHSKSPADLAGDPTEDPYLRYMVSSLLDRAMRAAGYRT